MSKNWIFNNWKDDYNMYSELIKRIQDKQYTYVNVGEAAEEVLKDLGVNGIPIPIVAIAQQFGFKVYQQEMEDRMSGFVAIDKKWVDNFETDKLMIINANHNSGHKKFTIAHELGHYILDYSDQNKPYYDAYFSDLAEVPAERRVNQFAANLLMPKVQFLDEYNIAKNLNKNTIAVLAERFGVSAKAIETRMKELNLE